MRYAQMTSVVALALVVGAFTPQRTPKGVEICTEDGGCSIAPKGAVVVKPDLKTRPKPPFYGAEGYMGEPLDRLRREADGGSKVAAYKLGTVYEQGLVGEARDLNIAERYFRRAADAGDIDAAYEVGKMLIGANVSPEELQSGVGYLQKARAAGHPLANLEIGKLMYEGRVLARNIPQAAALFEQAAEDGVPDAQYFVGQMYFRGVGKRLDGYQAIKWTREAATNGSVLAQRALGQIYYAGYETIRPDVREARKWMSAAAQQGDPEAASFLQRLDEGLYIAGGEMARLLPAGDLIQASSAVERAIKQASQSLNDGRGIGALQPVVWSSDAGATSGSAQVAAKAPTPAGAPAGSNCYVVEATYPDGGKEKTRSSTVCEGADGKIYEA